MILPVFFSSQTFVRHSDDKTVDSIVIVNANNKKILNKSNFRNYKLNENDKVLYNNRALDFYLQNDTLVFFDKVKEIKEVEIVNYTNKSERKIKSNKKRSVAEVFANSRIATLVKINTSRKTFVKSISLVQRGIRNPSGVVFDGYVRFQLLENKNGFPDDASEILSFERKPPKMEENRKSREQKWEINLPQIIEYPKDGFFMVLFIETDKKHTIGLQQNDDSFMYIFYPNEGWKKREINGYYYQLKILQ